MATEYSHGIHLHNYACWTAARAAQRRFRGAKTEVVKHVLEAGNFPKSLEDLYESSPTREEYDAWHQSMVGRLQIGFEQVDVPATYGQVAKIIAIYVKTVYVARYPESTLAMVAHPPIDRVLLRNVRACKSTAPFAGSISWTKFDSSEYHTALGYLRKECSGQPFWAIERYWTI